MTAELIQSLDKNGENEMDCMLGTYEKEGNITKKTTPLPTRLPSTYSCKLEDIVLVKVLAFSYLHVSAFYGMYLIATGQVKWSTMIFEFLYGIVGAIGITAGAHRLWAHGAYKATWQLRFLLMMMQTLAFQNSIWHWVRDHRVHHKYTDTNADPHNFSRGFFFAHMGWLMVKKHPLVQEKGGQLDMSDIERDPICRFQHKYYLLLMPVMSFVVPVAVVYFVFGQSFSIALNLSNFRYFISLQMVWLVNSAAHFWGDKPFDKDIKPTNNELNAFITIGEGWHNYHHVFPWDYKSPELGINIGGNLTTNFIDLFASVGWAYDLKTVSNPMICKRALRTGDGSYNFAKHKSDPRLLDPKNPLLDGNGNEWQDFQVNHDNMLWGWNDKDLPEAARQLVDIRNQQ